MESLAVDLRPQHGVNEARGGSSDDENPAGKAAAHPDGLGSMNNSQGIQSFSLRAPRLPRPLSSRSEAIVIRGAVRKGVRTLSDHAIAVAPKQIDACLLFFRTDDHVLVENRMWGVAIKID